MPNNKRESVATSAFVPVSVGAAVRDWIARTAGTAGYDAKDSLCAIQRYDPGSGAAQRHHECQGCVRLLRRPLGGALVRPEPTRWPIDRPQTINTAIGEAFRHRGYLLLNTGYIVCGFQTL